MERESVDDMRRLRVQARRLGLAIRAERASRGSDQRTYRVIDSESGQVIGAGLHGTFDVREQLWWIIRERRGARSTPGAVTDPPTESCPACGTPRVGFFRLCLSCGLDYEAAREPTSTAGPKPLPKERLAAIPPATTEVTPVLDRLPVREPLIAKLGRLAHDVRVGDRLGFLRPLAGAALVGLLAGGIVALALEGLT